LRHNRIHAEDCAVCTTTAGYIDRIERDITLSGDLDAEQRDRLMQIAERCPVHRMLHGEINITTTQRWPRRRTQ